MRAFCRNLYVVAWTLVLIAGCESPVADLSESTEGGESTQHKSATTAPADNGPAVVASVEQDDVLATLARIEQLVAAAVDSSIFAPEPEPEPEVVSPAPPSGGNTNPADPSPSPGGAYKVVEVSDGGTITGKITFDGTPRGPKVFKIEKTPEVCGKEDRLLYEVTVDDGGNLKDVVLALEGIAAGKPYTNHVILGPPPGTRGGASTGAGDVFPGTVIEPKKCIFGAFTGVIADGAELRFDNKDPVKHSPHTYFVKGRVRKSDKNQDLEGNGKLVLTIKFKKKYKILKLECDQHPHMQNWFYRVENPYYAFSAADGTFSIENVPSGNYKLIAWHPILGEQEQDVTIAANGSTEVTYQFSSKRRR